ncbi:MAG: sucrase ferredoxin [Pseudomonadales bacterium]
MSRKETSYCSLQSPDLPMAGTSDHVDVWLMLEYVPTWTAKVLEDNSLSAATSNWLEQQIERLSGVGLRVRTQFIRQPEYDRTSTKCFVATQSATWQLEGQGYDFLHDLDLQTVLAAPQQYATLVDQPQYFVCMNGQRDVCCARFGRPVYSALRERLGERVWQVSHLGGHRFAPNVLCLPQGAMYGRVAAEDIDSFVSNTETLRLDFPYLRGQAWYPKPVQAAEVFAEQQGLRLEKVSEQGAQTLVSFESSGSKLEVVVEQADQPVMALASCNDSKPKPVYPFRRVL